MTTRLKVMGSLVLATAAIGCGGRDTGYLYKDQPVQHDEPLGTGLPLFHYDRVTWAFECPTNTSHVQIPQAGPTELVFKNQGPFRLPKERLEGTAIKIMGEMCEPASFARDITIVIDVSGSMGGWPSGGNDPSDRGGKSCGRLRAFHAVMNSVDWTSTQVATLTFDDALQTSSEGFFTSKDALIAKLTNNNTTELHEVLCAAGGGTEYTPPLKEARSILRSGRPDATKEIFFLTDGEPTDKSKAEREAMDLHLQGVNIGGTKYPVTIATMMLGKDTDGSEYLRDNYASNDNNGKPIHANVQDADKLAEALKNMVSKIELVGSVVEHGDAKTNSWQKIDVMPHRKGFTFELPEFYLDPAALGDSYELRLVYWDSRMNQFKIRGVLEFSN